MNTRRLEIFAFTAMLFAMVALFVALQSNARADDGPAASAPAAALAPEVNIERFFNYQGFLRNPDDSMMNGSHTVTIKLYTAASGGTPFHTEPFNAVPVADGMFNVVLGTNATLPANFGAVAPIFIGVSVDGPTELIPRQHVYPVPWALQADSANTATTAGTATTLVPNASVSSPVLNSATLNGSTKIGGTTAVIGPYGQGVEIASDIFVHSQGGEWKIYSDNGGVSISGNGNILGSASVGGGLTANGKSVVVGEEVNLRIVRGMATANATVGQVRSPLLGAGFTFKKISTGVVDVAFTTPFSGSPVVTANAVLPGSIYINLEALGGGGTPTAAGFRAVLFDQDADVHDVPFNFIAIGPRSIAASASAEVDVIPADALPASAQ